VTIEKRLQNLESGTSPRSAFIVCEYVDMNREVAHTDSYKTNHDRICHCRPGESTDDMIDREFPDHTGVTVLLPYNGRD